MTGKTNLKFISENIWPKMAISWHKIGQMSFLGKNIILGITRSFFHPILKFFFKCSFLELTSKGDNN